MASPSAKLQIRPGAAVAVAQLPVGVDLELPSGCLLVADAERADAVLVFARNRAELDEFGGPAFAAAARDALAWIAYPKGGQLGTDLNRDSLAAFARGRGVRPVRQVAVDDVWSALRFRPAEDPS